MTIRKHYALKATFQEIESQLLFNDFSFWFQKLTIKQARERIQSQLAKKVSASDFAKAKDSCVWFKKTRRPGPSRNTLLSEKQWKQLANAVHSVAHELEGRTTAEVVAIVCVRKKTNEIQLNGLLCTDRVWEHKPKANKS